MKFRLIILVLMLGMINLPANAASKTGLSSSLIEEWHSEVNRDECPDFRYPSHQPSIVTGAQVYKQKCASCHGVTPSQGVDRQKFFTASPEKQFEAVCGGKHKLAAAMTIDERWDSLMYMRTAVLGYYPKGSADAANMDSIFGGNCAVCHGTRGQGDGNLHKMLLPPPANFQMFKRLYTRSDLKLFNEISHGIPWTAMPAWASRYDFDKNQAFDQKMIMKLVRYVRSFGYTQDTDRLDKGRSNLETYKHSIGEGN